MSDLSNTFLMLVRMHLERMLLGDEGETVLFCPHCQKGTAREVHITFDLDHGEIVHHVCKECSAEITVSRG